MPTQVTLPADWDTVPVQFPLFLEHRHTLMVHNIRGLGTTRVVVKLKGAEGDALQGRVISETFDIAKRRGKERFKDFLLAARQRSDYENGDGKSLDLEACLGNEVEVMAVQRPSGRWKVLHYTLRCFS